MKGGGGGLGWKVRIPVCPQGLVARLKGLRVIPAA